MKRGTGPEAIIQHAVREALGRDPRVILWRNARGTYKQTDQQTGKTRWIVYGLAPGASDLIGMLRGSGRFIALEVKTGRGVTSAEQTGFIDLVNKSGGFGQVVHSVEEALSAITKACET